MATLSSGRFPNRNNADCVRDPATRRARKHHRRDLEPLGDYLLARHTRAIAAAGMQGRALAGDLPFHWHTDFAYTWSDGWLRNQGADPRARPDRDHPRPPARSGGDHGRSLRHRLHGGPMLRGIGNGFRL